jgi:hypothetical protein
LYWPSRKPAVVCELDAVQTPAELHDLSVQLTAVALFWSLTQIDTPLVMPLLRPLRVNGQIKVLAVSVVLFSALPPLYAMAGDEGLPTSTHLEPGYVRSVALAGDASAIAMAQARSPTAPNRSFMSVPLLSQAEISLGT